MEMGSSLSEERYKNGARNVVVLAWPFQSIIYTVLTSHVRSTEGCMPCGLTTVFLVSKSTEVILKKAADSCLLTFSFKN